MSPHVRRRIFGGLLALMIVPCTLAEISLARELDSPPNVISQPAPTYPYEKRANGVMGVVLVRSWVNAAGEVERSEVVAQTSPAFGEAAYESVRRWKYSPARKQGVPVVYIFQCPVAFALMGDSFVDPERRVVGFPEKPSSKVPAEYKYDSAPYPEDNPRPVYPYAQWLAKTAGQAKAGYAVDERGRVIDVQISKDSDPEFGLALAAAIQTWQFRPATAKGAPRKALAAITFDFDLYQPPESSALRLRDMIKHGEKLYKMSDLDTPLQPLHQVSPNYPLTLAHSGPAGEAVIEFVVDRDGWVALPRIVSATQPEFGWSAATAVSQWRFTPPRKGGQPVDVRVRVPFDFSALPK